MTTEQRRCDIVRVAIPLVTEHGINVTTRQIAQAAEIAEGTVFRVFADKEELLRACIAEVFRTDILTERIRQVATEQDVENQLLESCLLIMEQFERFGALMRALVSTGYAVDRKPSDRPDFGMDFIREVTNALADVLRRNERRWKVSVEELAQTVLGVLSSLRFDPNSSEDRRAAFARRIDIVLHGAAT